MIAMRHGIRTTMARGNNWNPRKEVLWEYCVDRCVDWCWAKVCDRNVHTLRATSQCECLSVRACERARVQACECACV